MFRARTSIHGIKKNLSVVVGPIFLVLHSQANESNHETIYVFEQIFVCFNYTTYLNMASIAIIKWETEFFFLGTFSFFFLKMNKIKRRKFGL